MASALPLYPWKCSNVSGCDSARESPCAWNSGAGPDCAAHCDAFMPVPVMVDRSDIYESGYDLPSYLNPGQP